ncbi:hypothetical protein FGG08_005846 [Glutinoglossum americanum]|uniref:HNH nuclease domain-containing protein n=1 Tax=Glutinoglossum americanum TaxID=1670608 RepID=A0A9P8L2I5_9PEZI|nr:hypothetical protein FGG08_005846 [Glutinoglossum americanum]
MSNSSESLPPATPKRRQSAQSSPRKRDLIYSRHTSLHSSASAFSQATKNKIAHLDDAECCWHCGAKPTDICHVISQKDKATPNWQFKELVVQGLLTFSSLSHIDNGIPLCPLCHRNFDDILFPGFVFIPTDLAFFIKFEQDDYERRTQIAQATGQVSGRTCPTAEDYFVHQLNAGVIPEGTYNGLYARYTLHDYFPKLGQPPFEPGPEPFAMPKPWHGAPTAALRRAFQVLSNPLLQGIPTGVLTDLNTLIQLYRSGLSHVDATGRGNLGGEAERQDGESAGLGATRNSHLGGHGQAAVVESNAGPGFMTSAAPNADPALHHQSSKSVLAAFPTTVDACDSVSVSSRGSGPQQEETRMHSDMVMMDDGTQLTVPWKWGPSSTSEMVAEFYQELAKGLLPFSSLSQIDNGIPLCFISILTDLAALTTCGAQITQAKGKSLAMLLKQYGTILSTNSTQGLSQRIYMSCLMLFIGTSFETLRDAETTAWGLHGSAKQSNSSPIKPTA